MEDKKKSLYDRIHHLGLELSMDRGDHYELTAVTSEVAAVQASPKGAVILALFQEAAARNGLECPPTPAILALCNQFAKDASEAVEALGKTMTDTLTRMPKDLIGLRVPIEEFMLSAMVGVASETWSYVERDADAEYAGSIPKIRAAARVAGFGFGTLIGQKTTAELSAMDAAEVAKEAIEQAKSASKGIELTEEQARQILRKPRGQA